MYFYDDAKLMFCPETDTLCQGNRCMKWRWANAERTHGYCGAAGPQPEFPVAELTGDQNAYTLEHIEIFGHTTFFGRISEIIKQGVPMLLIEVPLSHKGFDGPVASFAYSPRAVFSRSPTTIEKIMRNAVYVAGFQRDAPEPLDIDMGALDWVSDASDPGDEIY